MPTSSSSRRLGSAALALFASCVWIAPLEAAKPAGAGLVNPAWVVLDGNGIKLLAANGTSTQTLLKSGRVNRYAPAYSPDGQWIAYLQRENNANQIFVMRADGSASQRYTSFTSTDLRRPVQYYGLQWVPGEVDRILYTADNADNYVFSTQRGTITPLIGTGLAPALSPDLDPTMAGYQGAVAYGQWNPDSPEETQKVDLHFAKVADSPAGLVVDSASMQVLAIPGLQVLPTWSTDGFTIAFLEDGGSYSGEVLRTVPVFVAGPEILIDESGLRTLEVRPAGIYDRPTWSPNDRWIGYIGQVGGAPGGGKLLDLFVVRSDGSQAPINVTNSHADAINSSGRPLMPHWNPLWIDDVEGQ